MGNAKESIFKISSDKIRAKDLFEMSQERLNVVIAVIPKSLGYKILEEYYEVAVQLITAIMYTDGYKTLSHISLIQYLKKYDEFERVDLELLDNMRKFRHRTVYYGRKESGNFLINHELEIKHIVKKLASVAKGKIF